MDAAGHHRPDQGAEGLVFDRALIFHITAAVHAVTDGLVLQIALAALIANRAIQRMVNQQQFHNALAHFFDGRGIGGDDHAFANRHGARSDRLGCALHFDQAHATVTGNGQAFVITEARDFDADALARLQHG